MKTDLRAANHLTKALFWLETAASEGFAPVQPIPACRKRSRDRSFP